MTENPYRITYKNKQELIDMQKHFTDVQLNRRFKTTLIVLGTLAFLLVLGLIGHEDRQTQLEQDMATTCNASDQELGRWAHDCQRLIKAVQADGHHEVVSDGMGRYWTEAKK